jgi:murein DD-endopeptidase MepM/ murein hydrolase activator NlpD
MIAACWVIADEAWPVQQPCRVRIHAPGLLSLSLLLAAAACTAAFEGPQPGSQTGVELGDPDSLEDQGGADAGPSATEDPGTEDPVTAAVREGRVQGTGAAGLNLRAEPNVAAQIKAVLPEGTVVVIVSGADAGWFRVDHAGDEGYVNATYLFELEPGGGGTGEGFGGLRLLLPWQPGNKHAVTQGHGYGSHTDGNAWAWDFAMPIGTPLVAVHDGVVRAARGDSTLSCCAWACVNGANYVVVDRGDGVESNFVHLSSTTVHVGQRVTRGELIGYSGQSGYSCGPHLHFQMQRSPSGGGTTSWFNQSVPEKFNDIGSPFDPAVGTSPESKNGVLDIP